MSIVRVKGFQIFKDRHGRDRCYHRKTRTPIDLLKAPLGSPEFFAECDRIAALTSRVDQTKPGSLGALIKAYRAAKAFQDLKPVTQDGYQRIFDYLKPIDGTPLPKFTPPFIVKLRDKVEQTRKRHFANRLKTVLSLLFSWGKERGHVKDNPAIGIKRLRRPRDTPKQNRRWTDSEREAVLDAAPTHLRVPLALMAFTGLGPTDALTLPRTAYRNGVIDTRRSKTGVGVTWRAIAPLRAILDSRPDHAADTLCTNSAGKAWTVTGFNASWRKFRIKLEADGRIAPGLTLYGLRHTVATLLREAGHDTRTIADALGQKTEAMARHYSDEADLTPKMMEVAGDFEREVNKRKAALVKPGR